MPGEFGRYLAKKAGEREKYIPCYLKWARGCYTYMDKSLADIISVKRKVSPLIQNRRLDAIQSVYSNVGRGNFQTTMIYTHVDRKNLMGVRSPLNG
ncbi:hypothetical protein BMS3Abin07_01937 [bacterium BMS3Abin07]|nr:hypothetical protein BMS3Abin07_01937 [bacterium BMS3Abin07]GBE32383.1 hypothetical protein BMS3Bbin05_01298 [bacterium BMS3Bbin05]HDL20082.1 hypothetical protein [Nitrospirota bacterium]